MLTLEIITPTRCILKTSCLSVTIPGNDGYIKILAGHIILLSKSKDGVLYFETEKNNNDISDQFKKTDDNINKLVLLEGIVEIKDDEILILCKDAYTPNDINEKQENINLKNLSDKIKKNSDVSLIKELNLINLKLDIIK